MTVTLYKAENGNVTNLVRKIWALKKLYETLTRTHLGFENNTHIIEIDICKTKNL